MSSVIYSFYEDAIKLASTLVVKRKDLSDANETLESAMAFERYLNISRGLTSVKDFITIDKDILQVIFSTPDEIAFYHLNPSKIPAIYHNTIIDLYKVKYYDTYEEKNNYYRMLFGLPDLAETLFVYVTDVVGVNPLTPVHRLSLMELAILELNGKVKELIQKYPAKKYLSFLGNNRIDFVEARAAAHLDIIRIDETGDLKTRESFMREYYVSRKYHLATVYNPDAFLNKDYYDGFLGFMILVYTIRAIVTTNNLFLENEELLNDVLKSYDLYDYFYDLPLTQKKRLVENIDNLLTYSGSDKVLIDISDIFGYKTTINRYYLIKRHNKDDNGNIVFPKLGDGTPDYDNMYRLDFLKVNVADDRIDFSGSKFVDYDTVTERDNLWDLEPTYLTTIKSEDFNVLISKYVSIESAYEISNLVFEMSYFLNLLIDNRAFTSGIKATNMYSGLNSSDLFTMLMFLYALMAEKNNYDGNITHVPIEIAQILKFNLESTVEEISDINREYNLNLKVGEFLLAKNPAYTLSAIDLKNLYVANRVLYDKISGLIQTTTTLEKFIGLNKLKELLFISDNISNVFMKANGQIAGSYHEMLADLDPSLALRIDLASSRDELDVMIQYTLEKLNELFADANLEFLFLNTPDIQDRTLKTYFNKMVRLFISSDTDIDTFDMVYVISGESNIIRVFDNFYGEYGIGYRTGTTVIEKIGQRSNIFISDITDHLGAVTIK